MQVVTPMRAIRLKCIDCSGGQPKEIRLCMVRTCALWPYRMGKRPKKKDCAELVACGQDM